MICWFLPAVTVNAVSIVSLMRICSTDAPNLTADVAIVSAGHALGVLNYVFLSSEGIKPDTRQAFNIYRLSYSFVGFVCVQVCDHCSSMQLDIIMSPFYVPMLTQNESRHQKTGLRGFRPGPTNRNGKSQKMARGSKFRD